MAPAASRMDQYFDDEAEDDFMMRIVHNSCNGTATVCSNTMSCQPALEQFDVLTHCSQPLDFLSFFQPTPRTSAGEMLQAGAYTLPRSCEYCGSADVLDCRDCKRPKLYFSRKKPPFCNEEIASPNPCKSSPPESPRRWVIRGLMWH